MSLQRFDLNLLRALDLLLEERNVTRAAERLFVTQQAASGALKRLRDHFDDKLLIQVGRNLELTPLGSSLVIPVREALLAAQAALDTRPTFDPTATRATFRVAMSDYSLFVLLPLFLQQLGAEAPHAKCRVETIRQNSFDRLTNGDLDFYMTANGPRFYGIHGPGQGIRSMRMFEDDFVCVIDPAHINLTDGMTLEKYQQYRHNTVAFGEGLVTLVEAGWAAAGISVDVAVAAPSFSALIGMLPGTSLIATVQRRLAIALAPRLGLAVVECPVKLPLLEEHLMWHERTERSPAHCFLRSVMASASQRLRGTDGISTN